MYRIHRLTDSQAHRHTGAHVWTNTANHGKSWAVYAPLATRSSPIRLDQLHVVAARLAPMCHHLAAPPPAEGISVDHLHRVTDENTQVDPSVFRNQGGGGGWRRVEEDGGGWRRIEVRRSSIA